MDYEETTKALFLSSEEGLFPTVEEGVELAESTIDTLRFRNRKNNFSVEIVFYVCDKSAEKKKTKDVAPHYHILLLAHQADKIVRKIEEYLGGKINKECHLYAVEVYDVDSLLIYIRPQTKKIRSLAVDSKGLPYFEAAKAKRSNYSMIEADIRMFTSKSLTAEVGKPKDISMISLWEALIRKPKDKTGDADLSWLDT